VVGNWIITAAPSYVAPGTKAAIGTGITLAAAGATSASPQAANQEGLFGTALRYIVSPVRSVTEFSRGTQLDRALDERRLREAQVALATDSVWGEQQLRSLQQIQANRAVGDASFLAEGAIEFNAAALGGGFVRPGASAGSAGSFAPNAQKSASQSFKSFDSLKRSLGPAGEGQVYHHIVEQRAANVQRFGAETIHNTQNVVAVPRELNQTIANYYSSKRPSFTGNVTVREWLNTKSYAQQREFGSDILTRAVAGKPLP
jgi:hypothetical protein